MGNAMAGLKDLDGAITQVQFKRGNTLLGTVTSPPYQVTLSNLQNGTYVIEAFATSNRGPIGDANTTIQVMGPNTPPVISITSPGEKSGFTPPAALVTNIISSPSRNMTRTGNVICDML